MHDADSFARTKTVRLPKAYVLDHVSLVRDMFRFSGDVLALCVGMSSMQLVVACRKPCLAAVDVHTGTTQWLFSLPMVATSVQLVNRDASALLFMFDKTLQLWDVSQQCLMLQLASHISMPPLHTIALHPSLPLVAAIRKERLCLWVINTGQLVARSHCEAPSSAAILIRDSCVMITNKKQDVCALWNEFVPRQ